MANIIEQRIAEHKKYGTLTIVGKPMKIGLCHKCDRGITKNVRPGVKEVVGCLDQPSKTGGSVGHTCPLIPPSEHASVSGKVRGFMISR